MVTIDYELFSQLREICLKSNEVKYKYLSRHPKDINIFHSFEMERFRNFLYENFLIRFFWYGQNQYIRDTDYFLINDWEYKIIFLEKIVFDFPVTMKDIPWIKEDLINQRLIDLNLYLDSYVYQINCYLENISGTINDFLLVEPNFTKARKELKILKNVLKLIRYCQEKQPLSTDLMLSPTMSAPDDALVLSPNNKDYYKYFPKRDRA